MLPCAYDSAPNPREPSHHPPTHPPTRARHVHPHQRGERRDGEVAQHVGLHAAAEEAVAGDADEKEGEAGEGQRHHRHVVDVALAEVGHAAQLRPGGACTAWAA